MKKLDHRTSSSPTRRRNGRRQADKVEALVGVCSTQHVVQPFLLDCSLAEQFLSNLSLRFPERQGIKRDLLARGISGGVSEHFVARFESLVRHPTLPPFPSVAIGF